MTIKSSTLRPGLLVSLKTQVTGNVQYEKRIIESEHQTASGALKARWETERTIADAKEHEEAAVARAKCSTLIRNVCARSAFGLLCPETSERELESAMAEARRVADNFNERARKTRISVYVITGRIAPDDLEAVRAINSEVRDLLEDMNNGVRNLDVKIIRDAANRARNLGSMLTPDAQARIQIAIDSARSAARKIVKAGEEAAIEIDCVAVRRITEARTAFLDLDPVAEIVAPKTEGRSLDLSPSVDIKTLQQPARSIEMV